VGIQNEGELLMKLIKELKRIAIKFSLTYDG
jgi:hypothetical protein